MILKLFISLVVSNLVLAQYDGNFWWLNAKLSKYRELPPPPKFEDLSEFDTDESDKIIFKDEDYLSNDVKPYNYNDKDEGVYGDKESENADNVIHFRDRSEIAWPGPVSNTKTDINNIENKVLMANESSPTGDVFEFKFPDEDSLLWSHKDKVNVTKPEKSSNSKNKTINKIPSKVVYVYEKIPTNILNTGEQESESICTFVKKAECTRMNGVAYVNSNGDSKKTLFDTQLICCILPLQSTSSKIHFKSEKRHKRSTKSDVTSQAMKQRNFLLSRKYAFSAKPTSSSAQKVTEKVVTSQEYTDPYWNIKNSNFKDPNSQNRYQQTASSQYGSDDDYVEDYVVEIPKPGLVGLYSDHSPPSWSYDDVNSGGGYGGVAIEDDGDSGVSFGYSATVDPRLEDRLTASSPRPMFQGRPGKPVKMTTVSIDRMYDAESQTISYQSNPDFNVLQGFKLLNIARNKSRIHTTNKKATTVGYSEDDSAETVITESIENYYDDIDTDQQLYKDCGKAAKSKDDKDKAMGDAGDGSHPWLAVVVLTRRQQNILCYATLVNTRAAVTVGDCVHGRMSPGDITLMAGVHDLNRETQEGWQKRMVATFVHPQYKPGRLANNLAILHWKRPLRLNSRVQPVCLSDPHVGDECKFYGWGGYDQAIRSHSRWQRAEILTPRACPDQLSTKRNLPSDAFCASVLSRGTVTGIGGPLICTINGRHSAVGVAVWRDNVIVLLPAQDWIAGALTDMHL